MDAAQKIALIEQQIADANDGSPVDFEKWRQQTSVVMRLALGATHNLTQNINLVRYTPNVWSPDSPASYFDGVRTRGVRNAISILEAGRFELGLAGADEPAPDTSEVARQAVFIVHGHDEALKETVARHVAKITDQEPIILHEKANQGRTIIEKFEDHAAEAGFAIVLGTADDVGTIGGVDVSRARQNVVFELGFFFGLLGRGKVAFIYDSVVELPSDINGVAYIPLSDWKHDLPREMRAAGIDLDMNKAF
jgi:hypothetical protein